MLKCSLLRAEHNREAFDCGEPRLNTFLRQFANQYAKRGLAKTHILYHTEKPSQIIGFYTLTNIHLDQGKVAVKGYPPYLPIPAILVGRLAVDRQFHGQDFSKQLLASALYTIKQLAENTGIAMVAIDAKSEPLAQYYERLGFARIDVPLRLIRPVAHL